VFSSDHNAWAFGIFSPKYEQLSNKNTTLRVFVETKENFYSN
jgi:hypothetical protein